MVGSDLWSLFSFLILNCQHCFFLGFKQISFTSPEKTAVDSGNQDHCISLSCFVDETSNKKEHLKNTKNTLLCQNWILHDFTNYLTLEAFVEPFNNRAPNLLDLGPWWAFWAWATQGYRGVPSGYHGFHGWSWLCYPLVMSTVSELNMALWNRGFYHCFCMVDLSSSFFVNVYQAG